MVKPGRRGYLEKNELCAWVHCCCDSALTRSLTGEFIFFYPLQRKHNSLDLFPLAPELKFDQD